MYLRCIFFFVHSSLSSLSSSRWKRNCWSRSSWSAASRKCLRRRTRTGSSLHVTSTTRGWGSCSSSSMVCRSAITTATWRKWRWVTEESHFAISIYLFLAQAKIVAQFMLELTCCVFIYLFFFIAFCRGRASWILKRRSSSRERNTRSPPHPHGASTCAHTHRHAPALTHSQRLWRPQPHTNWFSCACALTHTCTHSHMHTHTLEVSGVLAGPVGGWGDFFFCLFFSLIFLFPVCFL